VHEIRVPKLNNNDDTYLVLEWHAADGASVRADDPVVSIETSKTVEEITAPMGGIVRQLCAPSQECAPGDLIATVSAEGEVPGAAAADVSSPGSAAQTVTAAAVAYARQHGISPEVIASLGRTVVRVQDLQALVPSDAARQGTAPARPRAGAARPRGQGGVVRTVTAAAQIPAAYSLAHLDASQYVLMTRGLAEAGRAVPGPLEILLKVISSLYDRHSKLFVPGEPAGADAIGVTVDVGSGLYVPVVRDAATLPLSAIGALLAEYAAAARSGGFTSDQLRGARISVSVTAYAGVAFTVPLIHPDQVAMLSLGMLTSQVTMVGGEPRESTVLPLGISYDHRAVNGRDAIIFLRAIGSRFADQGFLSMLANEQPSVRHAAGRGRPTESR
jgi:2-oxoglutarate dehydrogenase E2 component (dihydrolipoamide succinyltransferase)